MKKFILAFTILVQGCSWMYPKQGGIALFGTLAGIEIKGNTLSPIPDCFYNVSSSDGISRYSNMQLYSKGSRVDILLPAAPDNGSYIVKIYCSGSLVKESMANSLDKTPTDMGTIVVR